ncbi:hypothetical protein [Streptomyces sp. NPDC057854]|uniref:hypothetical protein n=1 Tax=unclassified Streptomyces TaxID=2593676 RepID=UPI00369BE60E
MPRRMQANPDAPRAHHAEHEELWDCDRHPPCAPAEEQPALTLAEKIDAVPRIKGHPYHDIVRKADVLDALKGTVGVPDTGTVLVVDGVVQDVKPTDVLVHRCGVGCSGTHGGPGTVRYTVVVPPAKPAFFEPGKKYRRFVDWSIRAQAAEVTERFECTVVEKDGDGNAVAFGRLTVPCTTGKTNGVDHWTLMGGYQWKNDGWEAA